METLKVKFLVTLSYRFQYGHVHIKTCDAQITYAQVRTYNVVAKEALYGLYVYGQWVSACYLLGVVNISVGHITCHVLLSNDVLFIHLRS